MTRGHPLGWRDVPSDISPAERAAFTVQCAAQLLRSARIDLMAELLRRAIAEAEAQDPLRLAEHRNQVAHVAALLDAGATFLAAIDAAETALARASLTEGDDHG